MAVDINLFRWGPHHNELYTTKQLLTDTDFHWLRNYVWSEETVVGSETGRVARVWIYKDHVQETK